MEREAFEKNNIKEARANQLRKELGAKGSLLSIEQADLFEGSKTEDYVPVLEGEKLEALFSSYGLGFFKSEDGRYFFGTCHPNNTPIGIVEINKPEEKEIKALEQGEETFYNDLWDHWKGFASEK